MPAFFRKLPSDKIIYLILCALALAGNIYLFFFDKAPHAYGRDFNIYSAAVRTYSSGGNPYSVEELRRYSGDFLPFPYSPLTLPLFFVLNEADAHVGYQAVYLLFFLASYFLILKTFKNNDPLYLAVLLFSGFWAFYLNMMTGNIELFSLLVFALACFLYLKKRLLAFNLAIGSLAMLKAAPALFGLVPLPLLVGKKSKFRCALMLAGSLAFYNALSYALFGRIYLEWLRQLFSLRSGRYSAVRETLGGSGVSVFAMVQRYPSAETSGFPWLSAAIHALFSAAVIIGFFIFKKRAADVRAVFFFGILAVLLIMPRLRDYSFVYALIPVYYLTKDLGQKKKSIALSLCLIIPALSKTSVIIKMTAASRLFAILDYSHLISLVFLFGFIFIEHTRRVNQLQAAP